VQPLRLALRLTQRLDEHRPEDAILAVDQQLGEGAGSWGSPVGADRIRSVEVGEREDMEQLGAGSRPEGSFWG
jgi:hypothetical protein